MVAWMDSVVHDVDPIAHDPHVRNCLQTLLEDSAKAEQAQHAWHDILKESNGKFDKAKATFATLLGGEAGHAPEEALQAYMQATGFERERAVEYLSGALRKKQTHDSLRQLMVKWKESRQHIENAAQDWAKDTAALVRKDLGVKGVWKTLETSEKRWGVGLTAVATVGVGAIVYKTLRRFMYRPPQGDFTVTAAASHAEKLNQQRRDAEVAGSATVLS